MDEQTQKDIVRQGYDQVSYAYRPDEEDESCQIYHKWLDELTPLIQLGKDVLELGCGCGIPVARRLAQSYRYMGVDLSPVQIRRARRNVPTGQFLNADIAVLDFEPESFVAVIALYTIIHVPLSEQLPLFHRIYRWLEPKGYFLVTVGSTAWTGKEENWLDAGAAMAWSHADEYTYLDWLRQTGFNVLWTRFIPEGNGGHSLILAQK